jgi:hypothetical protein
MIPKKPAPHAMRGGKRFSEKILLQKKLRSGAWIRAGATAVNASELI